MFKKFAISMVAVMVLSLMSTSAKADAHWSQWEYIGNGVSVSFTQVTRDTWTWKFRNDEGATIRYMEFNYIDSQGTHPDILPVDVKPGAAFGGWAAFTSSTRPTIVIT